MLPARVPALLALACCSFLACGDDADGGTGGAPAGASGAGATSEGGTTATAGTGGSNVDTHAGTGGTEPGTGGSGQAGEPPVGGKACDVTPHKGEGTYYDADGSGNCSFAKAPGDVLVAAMNKTDYADSATCGTCLALAGPKGSVKVRIVDQCPECKPGDVDMHPGAFDQIAEHGAGRVAIAWTYVSCDAATPVTYHFKDGSNPYWTAVQVRNHANAIAKIEYRAKDGSFKAMVRQSYNYFLEAKGLGDKGPYALRVTDVFGNTIEDDTIPSIAEGDFTSAKQFPACSP